MGRSLRSEASVPLADMTTIIVFFASPSSLSLRTTRPTFVSRFCRPSRHSAERLEVDVADVDAWGRSFMSLRDETPSSLGSRSAAPVRTRLELDLELVVLSDLEEPHGPGFALVALWFLLDARLPLSRGERFRLAGLQVFGYVLPVAMMLGYFAWHGVAWHCLVGPESDSTAKASAGVEQGAGLARQPRLEERQASLRGSQKISHRFLPRVNLMPKFI